MHYKQIRVREETYNKLIRLAGILHIRYARKVSLSDTIDYLIEQSNIAQLKI